MIPVAIPAARSFSGWDWIVVGAYLAVLLGIGIHYSRRQRTTEEYFVGGRNVRPFLAGLSLFTATNSIIAYIGITGEYVQNGPTLAAIGNVFPIPIIYPRVGWVVIPLIMRLPITSVYELLESRLGLPVRRAGSLAYIATRLVWMTLILYTSSTVLVNVVGCDPRWGYLFTVVTGVVTTTYTLFGGIRTVMITEVVQFFMLLMGALLTIVSISVKLGGVSRWWPRHAESHWQATPFFSPDPHVRVTLLAALVTYLITPLCTSFTDQGAVQRLLSTRDARAARRTFLLSNLAAAVVSSVLSLVGAALLGFYHHHPEAMAGGLTFSGNGDALFPLFISHYLPVGISGLVVASLLASAMASLSSGINSTITLVSKDFLETSPANAGSSEAEKLRRAHKLALWFGAAVILGTIGIGSVRGNLFEVSGRTLFLFICPLFGFFFFALFVKFSTPFGAIGGTIYGFAAAVIVSFWDVLTRLPPLSFLWITPVSLVVTLAAGCLLSLLPTRGRSPAALGACAAAVFLVPIGLVGWLIGHYR
jgi:SSS family solute:Na+ symporter